MDDIMVVTLWNLTGVEVSVKFQGDLKGFVVKYVLLIF